VSDLDPVLVEPLLRGRLGRPYRFVEVCASTQRLLGDDDPEGAAVAADEQTEGRGRLGRRWEAPAGRAILCSVLLRPSVPMPVWPELSLVAGEAVAAALRLETGMTRRSATRTTSSSRGGSSPACSPRRSPAASSSGSASTSTRPPASFRRTRQSRRPRSGSSSAASSSAPRFSPRSSPSWSAATTPGTPGLQSGRQ